MTVTKRVLIAAALFGFAGVASASDLQMCFYPQTGSVLDVTADFLSCVVNALVEPA